MLDGMMVDVLFHNGKAIGVEVPQVVELKIIETAPILRVILKDQIKTGYIGNRRSSANSFSCVRR